MLGCWPPKAVTRKKSYTSQSPRIEFASAAGLAAVFESNPGIWVIRFPDTSPAALEARPSPHVKILHEANTGRKFEVRSP